MKRLSGSSVFWRLFLTHLAAALLAVATLLLAVHFASRAERQAHLLADARYMARTLAQMDWEEAGLASEDRRFAYLVSTRVGRALVISSRTLVAVQEGEPLDFRLHPEQPETTPHLWPAPKASAVTAALRSVSRQQITRLFSLGTQITTCPSATRGTEAHCMVLMPLSPRADEALVLIALFPPGILDDLMTRLSNRLWVLVATILLIVFLLTRSWIDPLLRPLRRLRQGVERLAAGNFRERVPGDAPGELGTITSLFNQALDQVEAWQLRQEEINRDRRDLVASVSHEFRAPIASLRGYLELFRDGVIGLNEQTRYVDVMLSDALRLQRLVEDLLEFFRLQAQQVTFVFEPVDAREACRRAAEQVAWRTADTGVALELDLVEGAPPVRADADRLEQALVNLLENGLRYAGEGGWVRLSTKLEEGAVRFSVSDSGPGIPPHAHEAVWRRFYKVEPARTPGESGSGLGLPIVRELVTSMGGQVGLESPPGQGATVWFTIPIA